MSKMRAVITFEDDDGDVYHTVCGHVSEITFNYGDSGEVAQTVLKWERPHTDLHVPERKP